MEISAPVPAMPTPSALAARLSSQLRRTPPLVAAMAVLGVGLVLSSAILVKGIRRANDTITVTGASTERIRSDHVDWSVSVAVAGPSQQASYQALQPLVSQTVAFLSAQGIPPAQIQRDAVRSEREDQRDPRTNELRSTTWTSRQEIRVSSADVDKVRQVAAAAGELIGQGVPLTINPPAFTYTKLAEKRVDMLAKATRDAAERARAAVPGLIEVFVDTPREICVARIGSRANEPFANPVNPDLRVVTHDREVSASAAQVMSLLDTIDLTDDHLDGGRPWASAGA